jgi:hypothetical protein
MLLLLILLPLAIKAMEENIKIIQEPQAKKQKKNIYYWQDEKIMVSKVVCVKKQAPEITDQESFANAIKIALTLFNSCPICHGGLFNCTCVECGCHSQTVIDAIVGSLKNINLQIKTEALMPLLNLIYTEMVRRINPKVTPRVHELFQAVIKKQKIDTDIKNFLLRHSLNEKNIERAAFYVSTGAEINCHREHAKGDFCDASCVNPYYNLFLHEMDNEPQNPVKQFLQDNAANGLLDSPVRFNTTLNSFMYEDDEMVNDLSLLTFKTPIEFFRYLHPQSS